MIDLILALVLIPVAILLGIHVWVHQSRVGRWVDKIPGPKGFPIIGNFQDLKGTRDKVFLQQRKFGNEYYPIYKYWILHRCLVNIRHPDDVETVLSHTKNIEKSPHVNLLSTWLGDGLILSKGEKWRGRRKMLNVTFGTNILEGFVSIFAEKTGTFLNRLNAEAMAQGGKILKNVEPTYSELSLKIICETAMGINLDDKNLEFAAFMKGIQKAGYIFQYRFMRPWLQSEWIFSLTSMGREYQQVVKVLHAFSKKIIEARKEYHQMNDWRYLGGSNGTSADQEDDKMTRSGKKLAFLDFLLAAWKRSGIDDAGLQEEVDMFVVAGHDTTSTALALTTIILAEHKDIQEKCRREINEVLNGLPIEEITMKELQQLNYLQQCIKESMRLYSVAPLAIRTLKSDLQLRDYFLPEGTEVAVQIFDVHRDPQFWPNPEVYDPERFSPENSKGRHPYSYLPFSLGPRNCIGNKFAMLELKTVLAGLISKFYLEPVELIRDSRLVLDFIIRFDHKMHVKFVPINN